MAETPGNTRLLAFAIAKPRKDVAIAPISIHHNSSINIRRTSDNLEQSIYNPDRTCIVANHSNDDDSIYNSVFSLSARDSPSEHQAVQALQKSHLRKNPRLGYQPERGFSIFENQPKLAIGSQSR